MTYNRQRSVRVLGHGLSRLVSLLQTNGTLSFFLRSTKLVCVCDKFGWDNQKVVFKRPFRFPSSFGGINPYPSLCNLSSSSTKRLLPTRETKMTVSFTQNDVFNMTKYRRRTQLGSRPSWFTFNDALRFPTFLLSDDFFE